MSFEKININEKLALFSDHWNPRIVGEVNNHQVKLAKFKGEFIWHKHEDEDELFLVLDGEFTMHFRDKSLLLRKNEFIIVPKGVEHKPQADNEVAVLLFEPASTVNTGDTVSRLTKLDLEKI